MKRDQTVLELYLSESGCVPVGPCPRCEREVVAYPIDDRAEAERFACIHCDTLVRQVAWLDDGDLDALGYEVSDPRLGGCASGCASGGCTAIANRAPGATPLRAAAAPRTGRSTPHSQG